MNDLELEVIIGRLLRTGVLTSAAIVALGGALYLAQHAGEAANYGQFVEAPLAARTLAGIAQSALRFDPLGLIQAGLVLLIATPVARVAVAIVGFAIERDRLYVLVSFIVLAILIASLLHAT